MASLQLPSAEETAITGIEAALVKVGQAVAKQLAFNWLNERKADARRGKDLSQLVRARFPVPRKASDVLAGLWQIEDEVAKQLAPTWTRTAHGLAENEQQSALDAVADALEEADLSDRALYGVDLDPTALAGEVRRQVPSAAQRAGLSQRAAQLYELTLERACVCLMHLVRELPEFDTRTAEENLRRLGNTLSKLDEVLDRLPVTGLDAPGGTNQDVAFLRRYLDVVSRSYDKLEVIGLTTHSYEPRTTLSVAYLSLTVHSESGRSQRKRHRAERLELDWLREARHAERRSENVRVEAALGKGTRTVVRGDAGAGKSTLLRWLAINAAHGTFTGELAEWNGCVPILVKLREFAERPLPRGDDLLRQPSSPQCGPIPAEWVHRQLESGRVLLLVDGVDELTQRQRDGVRDWLRGVLEGYPHVRVVVTSRPTAVTSKWLAREGFRSVELEPMTPADVREFLRRWHRALLDSAASPDLLPCAPEEVPEHERTLLVQLQARAHLRALARSPLLCAMLCALNLDRKGQLPRERQALYAAALDMLLERRDSQRNVASAEVRVARTEKQALLRALAWWLNENSRSEMSRDQALARISDRLRGMPNVHDDPEALLDHLVERSGVIRRPALERIDFVHRTFQEYLAAEEAVHRDSIDLLVRNARSDLWRETVLMGCAHAGPEQRGRLIGGILDAAEAASGGTARQLRLLAAACLETAVTIEPPEVIDRVKSCVRDLVPPRSTRESRSLSTVGESLLDDLPATLYDLSPARAAACVRTAALVNGPKALAVLARYATDERGEVQRELIDAWQYFDPQQYAEQVLADAPLDNGSLMLRDPDLIRHTGVLRKLQHLGLYVLEPVLDLNFLSKARKFESLYAASNGALSLAPLPAHAEEVQIIHLAAERFDDLPALKRCGALRYLSLRQQQPFVDLTFLPMAPLRILHLGRLNGVTDYHRITECGDLEELILGDCDGLRNFEFLGSFTQLRFLSVERCLLPDLAEQVAHAAPQLRNLWMDDTSVHDLVPLASMSLETLSVEACPLESLVPLADMPSLDALYMDRCPRVLDLAPLAELPQLGLLYLRDAAPGFDLTPLRDRTITIALSPTQEVHGLDQLGPNITLERND